MIILTQPKYGQGNSIDELRIGVGFFTELKILLSCTALITLYYCVEQIKK